MHAGPQKSGAGAMPALDGAATSVPHQLGRLLRLKFSDQTGPELYEISFRSKQSDDFVTWRRGDSRQPLQWTPVPKALAAILLSYRVWCYGRSPADFRFPGAKDGSVAATLGNAINDKDGRIQTLFVEVTASGKTPTCTRKIFGGDNHNGKANRERKLEILTSFLPPDCIEIFWDKHGESPLIEQGDIVNLANEIRAAMDLEAITVERSKIPSAEGHVSSLAPDQPKAETATSALRADLRAKLHRAQELHSRDERKQAIALIEEVFHSAQSHGLKEQQLEAVISLGFTTSARHDFKSLERRFREAEKLVEGCTDRWHQVQFRRLKAKMLLHKKHPAPAEQVLLEALTLSENGDSSISQVGLLARADFVHLLAQEKRAVEADAHVTKIREVLAAPEQHDTALLAELTDACVHWATSKKDTAEVRNFVRFAEDFATGEASALIFGHTLQDCANGARGLKATETAVICADAAARLGRIARRSDISFAAAYTAAGALAESEDFQSARDRCLQLVDVATGLPEPKLRFCVFQLLSQASRQLGDRTSAVEAAETALKNTEGDATAMCLAKMALAEALRDSGRIIEALENARAANQSAIHADLPPEWVEENIVLIADCAARLGDWNTSESYASRLKAEASRTRGAPDRRQFVNNRIRMHKMLRESLASVISAEKPLAVAKTEGADSVQIANAALLRGVVDAWKEYPKAAPAIYDYWGRGNLARVMLNMRGFPESFNMTLDVCTVEEARRAVRLWALIADVLVLIWKGPTISSSVLCPVPMTFTTSGGGGYLAAPIRDIPVAPREVTGLSTWEAKRGDNFIVAIVAKYASLLPPEVGKFLSEEALSLVASGRLIVVPATGICCVDSGFGPVESLFSEACSAIPAIKGDAARFPASWVPYFSDIPLGTLAEIVHEHHESLYRLRTLLFRRARQYRSSGITGTESKELELEIKDSLAEITDVQSGLRRRYGWGEAQEAVASRYDGFGEQELRPLIVLQSMGHRWRIERALGDIASESKISPKRDEPIGTWLHPADTQAKVITRQDLPRETGKRRPK